MEKNVFSSSYWECSQCREFLRIHHHSPSSNNCHRSHSLYSFKLFPIFLSNNFSNPTDVVYTQKKHFRTHPNQPRVSDTREPPKKKNNTFSRKIAAKTSIIFICRQARTHLLFHPQKEFSPADRTSHCNSALSYFALTIYTLSVQSRFLTGSQ